MAVRLITVAFLLGTLFGLTFARFKGWPAEDRRTYGRWLAAKARELLSAETWKISRNTLAEWTAIHYPLWTKWIFIILLAGFLFQALTGLFFEIFIGRGLFGLPLVGHMIGGGVFAAGLAALVLWRGRSYRLDEDPPAFLDNRLRPHLRAAAGAFLTKIFFWSFVLFGFVQVSTAAGSMFPVFSFATQETLLTIHRLGALGLIVAAAVFAERVFVPRRRP